MFMKLFRHITVLLLLSVLAACSGASENSEALSIIDTSRDSGTNNQITEDTTAPSQPENLQASSVTVNSVQLQWNASTDNVAVTGYRVFRNSMLLTTVTSTSYQDTTVTASSNFQYYVVAFDAANNTNSSSILNVTTPALIVQDTTPPTAPGNLRTSTAPTSTSVSLVWNASTDNVGVSGYRVYRNGTLIATTASISYTDNSVSASTSYTYSVRAFDAANNTSVSSSLVVNTPALADTTAPTTPTGLTASSTTSSSVALTWSASTDNVAVTRYYVYRNSVQIGYTSSRTFTDNGVQASTSYQYRVAAADAAGNVSPLSTILYVTTPAESLVGVVTLNWQPPLENTDGSTLTDLSGYKIYYGSSPDQLTNTITITNPGLTSYVIESLIAGTTYYFTITAINSQNAESDFSNVVTKVTSS